MKVYLVYQKSGIDFEDDYLLGIASSKEMVDSIVEEYGRKPYKKYYCKEVELDKYTSNLN